MSKAYFLGVDIGTQGARVALLDEKGEQITAYDEIFSLTENSREEQSPLVWWQTTDLLIKKVVETGRKQIDVSLVKAIAVTSTSGTIIPINVSGIPIHNALMYSDNRSFKEADLCKRVSEGINGYKAFNSSSGLPKMLWYLNNFGSKNLNKFIHAADFIAGNLCGNFNVTDYTNVLKSGYNVHDFEWPEYILELGIKKEWLQDVKSSGEPVSNLRVNLSQQWGLSDNVIVTTGMTDGCVSQVASGAVSPGQWNTTIGTTLVVKGVTKNEIEDPSGAIYNHRHPEGYWMPGGASNTGADWISKFFNKEDLKELNEKAAMLSPTGISAWPLLQEGERFPFFCSDARGFWPEDRELMYAACMEGVAYIEKYAYSKISQLSGEQVSAVFSAGGGSNSDTWLGIRSSVLNVPIHKMKNTTGAAGAAVLAASKTYYPNLGEAAKSMIKPEKTVNPDLRLVEEYNKGYETFLKELKERNYLR